MRLLTKGVGSNGFPRLVASLAQTRCSKSSFMSRGSKPDELDDNELDGDELLRCWCWYG